MNWLILFLLAGVVVPLAIYACFRRTPRPVYRGTVDVSTADLPTDE
jgi:hypothetical protein